MTGLVLPRRRFLGALVSALDHCAGGEHHAGEGIPTTATRRRGGALMAKCYVSVGFLAELLFPGSATEITGAAFDSGAPDCVALSIRGPAVPDAELVTVLVHRRETDAGPMISVEFRVPR